MSSPPLSSRLLAFREKHALTQEDLASVLGVTRRYLGDLENGKEIDTNGSLYKWYEALEKGQVPLQRQLGGKNNRTRETPGVYHATPRTGNGGSANTLGGLNPDDVLTQIRADISAIEMGEPAEKRRAYYFMYEVHMPMLARMLNLE